MFLDFVTKPNRVQLLNWTASQNTTLRVFYEKELDYKSTSKEHTGNCSLSSVSLNKGLDSFLLREVMINIKENIIT